MQTNPTASESDDAKAYMALQTETKISKRKINHSTFDSLSERWLDKQEVLQLMHISESTLQKWRKKGLLPYSRVLGKIYYKGSDLLQLLDECKKANRP